MSESIWMKKRIVGGGLALAGMALLAAVSHAQIPNEISYQAYLTDPAGQPITTNGVVVEIGFYDAAVGGALLDSFTSAPLDLGDSRGFVNLNVPVALSAAALDNEIWIEVTVDSEVLDPRQKLVASPQALNAARIGGLAPSQIVVDGGNQTVAGEKTFTDVMEINVAGISTSVSGETGSALSVRTTPDVDAGRAIAVRGRVQQNGAEPSPLPAATRPIQGVVGIALGDGGANTTLGGGYFFSRLQAASTAGAVSVSGVSADSGVEPGATTALGQTLVGGRFGADNLNAGLMSSIGVLATAAPGGAPTGTHLGPAIGTLSLGTGSVSHNVGVIGMANADPIAAFPGITGDLPATGVGVFAYNEVPGGVALRAKDQNGTGTALSVIGTTSLNGAVNVTGTVTSSNAPVNPEDLTRKDYVDAAVAAVGSGSFVDLTTSQTVAGVKTFTNNMLVDPPTVNTSVAGEEGAGISVRTNIDGAAWRGIGIRGRVLQNTPQPAGAPPAGLSNRQVQGVVGSASGIGGAETSISGGYFNGKLLTASTTGAALVTGISADANVESGATTAPGTVMIGGRLGADNAHAGTMTSVGVLATAAPAGAPSTPHLGPAIGAIALGAGSVSNNVGVIGMANADPITAFPSIAGDLPAAGVGVFAYNETAGGVALRAKDQNGNGTALSVIGSSSLNGNVAVTGTVTSTAAPVNPEDLVRKDYVDQSLANMGRVLWVVPTGGAATPDGTLTAPFDDVAAAYAEAKTMSPNFFNRVAILLAPGQHTLTSTLDMDTVGIDLIGFGELSAFLTSSVDPAITMTAPTSGAVIRNLNIQGPGASTNVLVEMNGGRLANVVLRRAGAGAGTLLRVDTGAGLSSSIRRFEVYGDVEIASFGAQTSFTDGFVTGAVNSNATSPTLSEFAFFSQLSGVGSFNFSQVGAAIVSMANLDLVGGISYPNTTLLRANSVNFLSPTFLPLALPDPASGSTVVNTLGDTSAWAGAIGSTGNVPAAGFNAFTTKP